MPSSIDILLSQGGSRRPLGFDGHLLCHSTGSAKRALFGGACEAA